MPELRQEYLDILEKREWSVSGYTDDGCVELEWWSPAGEDFLVCVNVENFPDEILNYSDDFDPDEHIEMWVEARANGRQDVPGARRLAASGWDILSVYHSRFPHRLHPAHVTVPEPGDAPKPEEDKSSPLPDTPPEPAQKPQLPVLDLDRNREGLTDDQLALIRVLDTETPLLTDEAAEQTGLPVRRVLSALTVLEIDGYAQRSGPRSYVRTVRLHSEKEGS